MVCMVTIESRFLGLSSKYNLVLKDGEQFVLSAKKEMMKINSNFIISKCYSTRGIHKRDENYVGLLSSNFSGTEFSYSNEGSEEPALMISYGKSVMGFGGVRNISVMKPKPGL